MLFIKSVKERAMGFIGNQVDRINEGGIPILIRNLFLLLVAPFLLIIVLFIRLLQPLILIRFGELISSRIGHFAGNTEIYLCERDLGMHGPKGLDIFYINGAICNRQLMKMWRRTLHIFPFATGLDLLNRALPGGEKHKIQYPNYGKDVYGALKSTKVHITFTNQEERAGEELLKKMGITNGSPFVCFLARSPAYLDNMYPRGNWHYHDYRDTNIKNFIPAAEELTRRGYLAVRMGAVVKEPLGITNPKVIDYAVKHRTEFLDIYLGAKCSFYLGDPCGFHVIPMIFRRPLAIVNMIPLEDTSTWGSDYLFIPKKLRLTRENRLLSFQEILGSGAGRFSHSQQYGQSGIEVIENTPEEISALAIEMDLRLKGEWKAREGDEELQQRFWELFRESGIDRVFRSRIGSEFLQQNKELLE